MLSDDAKAVLQYFWTTSAEEDPAFMAHAVEAGIHPEKFVDACATSLRGLSDKADVISQEILDNRDEAAKIVAGILGFM